MSFPHLARFASQETLQKVDVSTLLSLADYSDYHLPSLVRTELDSRLARLLQPFMSKPRRFMRLLDECRAVISGAFALKWALGASWDVEELDVFVPHSDMNYMVRQLEGMGYTSTTIVGDTPGFRLYDVRSIRLASIIFVADTIFVGVWVVRRLQEDMKFSAGGEKFRMKYVIQSLRDWKTWVASTCF